MDLMARNDKSINLYLATTVGTWAKVSEEDFAPLIYTLFDTYKKNRIIGGSPFKRYGRDFPGPIGRHEGTAWLSGQ